MTDARDIDYDGRRFHPVGDPSRIAVYRQQDDLLWGEFSGGGARRGSLTGLRRPDGTLDFTYTMALDDGQVIAGHCLSTPHVLADGRVRLDEVWERFGAHAATGVSSIVESLS